MLTVNDRLEDSNLRLLLQSLCLSSLGHTVLPLGTEPHWCQVLRAQIRPSKVRCNLPGYMVDIIRYQSPSQLLNKPPLGPSICDLQPSTKVTGSLASFLLPYLMQSKPFQAKDRITLPLCLWLEEHSTSFAQCVENIGACVPYRMEYLISSPLPLKTLFPLVLILEMFKIAMAPSA